MVDLRLINLAARDRRIADVLAEALPWTWGAFLIAVLSGTALFASKATIYWENGAFRWTLVLLLLAGLNAVAFHAWIEPKERHAYQARPSLNARFAGAVSLTLWVSIVAFGRWIGFLE